MAEWFQTKVKFLRQMDNGLIKAVTEQYLVDALSFTEAEARILMEVGEGTREITMMSVARSNIKEVVFYGDTDLWYKVKVIYIVADEESEKEKKVTTFLLVNANDLREAYDRTEEHLKEMVVPYSVPQIQETPIMEVYQHQTGWKPGMKPLRGDDLAEDAAEATSYPKVQPKDAEGGFSMPEEE